MASAPHEELARSSIGLGVRPELFNDIECVRPNLGFYEAHSENYFGASLHRDQLIDLARQTPISLHGVGLSLGRADALDQPHLKALASLVEDINPVLVSEHLAWSAFEHYHVPDLLPLPLNAQTFQVLYNHVSAMQDALGRQVLIENPSNYLAFDNSEWAEPDFLNALADGTGCGLLLDVNNVYVSAINLGRDPHKMVDGLDSNVIQQYHLAGHTSVKRQWGDEVHSLLIDTHNQLVSPEVWALFEYVVQRHGAHPTLIEWDSDFPAFNDLLAECETARRIIEKFDTASASDTPRSRVSLERIGEPTLVVQQRDFFSAVLNPEFKATDIVSPHRARINVYRNNVAAAVVAYLESVFPAVHGVVGAAYFKGLVNTFMQHKPPESGDLHVYGEHFPAWFSTQSELDELPYLADLARYEWGLHRAFYANISGALTSELHDPEILQTQPVRLNPSVMLIQSNYPIFEIHRQSLPNYTEPVSVQLEQSADCILVFKHLRVEAKVMTPMFAALLAAIQSQGTLGAAIESMVTDESVAALSESVHFLLSHRLLAPA